MVILEQYGPVKIASTCFIGSSLPPRRERLAGTEGSRTRPWRKRDSNHRSRLVAEILQRAAEIDRKFELKIIRCTVAKQVMAAVASGTRWRKRHSLGRGYKQASPGFKFAALPAKGRGSNPWSAQLLAQLSRPAVGSPARHRDAAVRAAFSCSACHSMEPTAHSVLTGCGLRCSSSSCARWR